ncbi:MAG TPA: flagellar hook-length control protein FliK [Limnobacter sp.]|nr:flagellar hook-length control protein FliK [Limnobacter sp.]
MTTSTTAMNNVSKLQIGTANSKGKSKETGNEMQFDALFSNALGQLGAQTHLGAQDSALRESLLSNKPEDKAKKNVESGTNPVTDAAMMWAQRDWAADNTPVFVEPQSTTTSAPNILGTQNNTTSATQSVQSKPQDTNKQIDAQDGEYHSSEQSKQATVQSEANGTSATKTTGQLSTTGDTSNTDAAKTAQTISSSQSADKLLASGQNMADSDSPLEISLLNDRIMGIEESVQAAPSQPGEKQGTRKNLRTSGPEASASASATASGSRAENNGQAGVGNTGSAPAANPIVAQVAAQLAQQNPKTSDSTTEPQSLQVGDKVMANRSSVTNNPAALVGGVLAQNSPTQSTAQTQIRTPVHQPGFAKELGNTVQWAIGKNLSTVDIRVNPESFGPLNMRLVQQGQQVHLVIRTQDEASANLLQQALGGLKEVMAQNGLQLNQVQVNHQNSTHTGQNPSFSGQQDSGQSAQGQQHDQKRGHGQTAEDGPTVQVSGPGNSGAPKGRLDLFA